ncbi:MAG: TonB-dependent receptor plug domain-containing protein [Flavobacteriaceae bacterium]|nr:TonB-dependent receptor plug domain-containing protein [Flavobacteriaceae bacterium]
MKKYIPFGVCLLPVLGLAQTEGKNTEIEEVVFQKKGRTSDLTEEGISAKQIQQTASVAGGVEAVLKTLPSVNSNAELSSQYMVRGGNYDENLIYINDIEVYRPFLVRNSQQEGMSIINPDMVSVVNFSAGGFEAKYGDKMSSVLNIYYRQPKKTEISGEISLVGGRLTFGTASKNKKFTALFSGRYRNINLILNNLNEETDFSPQYTDFQTYWSYHLDEKWNVSFLGYWSENSYQMIPKKKEVHFGTLLNPLSLNVYYNGKETDRYRNMMGTLSIGFKPNEKWHLALDNFAYQNREQEYYSIISGYRISTYNPETQEPIVSYDIGGQIDHARNDLLARVFGMQFRAKYLANVNTKIEVGAKLEQENLQDLTNEWRLMSYKGYNIKGNHQLEIIDNDKDLKPYYHLQGENELKAIRLSGYAQFSKKFFLGENKMFFNAGVRAQHWNFNGETLVSPRVQWAIKPKWRQDMLFRFSSGVYYQAPFYKEIKSLEGDFAQHIKAQRSLHFIAGNDYEFEWKKRPFKLTTELYYKKMDRLIPYYIDNVRVRYSGQNNAKGYAYGADLRLFGEFVPGVDSWVSASYARAFEDVDARGYIPRPTDQRFRFSMFYQDYMPKFPSMRVNITLVYASGLATGTPLVFDANGKPTFDNAYQIQKRLPSYKRVDIGLSKIFIDQNNYQATSPFWSNFKELTLGIQIFNAFNIHNTVANQWVNDFNDGYYYPVPIRLTGRFFNVKLEAKF